MTILLIAGHDKNTVGASGNGFDEWKETRRIVNALNTELVKYDCNVINYNGNDENKNAYVDIEKKRFPDFSEVDYAIEVHLNSGNSSGTLALVTPRETGISVEKRITQSISNLGFRNQGVRKENMYVINHLKNKGISSTLLEICFISSKTDMVRYESKFSQIIEAIAESLSIEFDFVKLDTQYKTFFVETGGFIDESDAEKLREELKNRGIWATVKSRYEG